jgi:hypothetical protein
MSLFDLVFGCWHKRCSFPLTIRGKLRRSTEAASVTGTYVVCLDCGREFPYDWSRMKMLASKLRAAWAAEPAPIIPGFKAASGLRWALREDETVFASSPARSVTSPWAGKRIPLLN